ncbi:MAG: DUF4932 domain-containing protein [Treponema sp.]|nr:DUF4932 domain-containing protein [Treponema sp.]
MKKILSVLILAITFTFTSFSAQKAPVLEAIQFEIVEDQGEFNKYIVDPRIEVISMICRLAEIEGFTYNYNGDNAFLTQMNTLFEKYKDHKAVKSVKDFAKKGIKADAMISLAYHIKSDFSGTLVDFSPFPETLFYSWKKISTNKLYAFVKEIHDFAQESNFPRIYLLNKGTYIGDTGRMKKDLEKAGIAKWAQDFFMDEEVQSPVINVSRLNVGCNYYDFVKDADGKRLSYLTSFPGTYYNSVEECYINFYSQLFASRNWDKVKDKFSKYMRAWAIKMNPDNKKNIEKYEYIDYDFTTTITRYCYILFLKECEPEYHNTYEELLGFYEKQFADENIMAVWDLILEYQANRDKYPTFADFTERIVTFMNELPITE